jgi:putative sigma-54 modulation protein
MMTVTVHAVQFDMTPGLKKFVLETLYEPLKQIWKKDGTELEIHLKDLRGTKGGLDKECRCILYMPNGPKIVITEITDEMRKSVHLCRKRLMRRARKYLEHKVEGPRRPTKLYSNDLAVKTLVRRAAKSNEIHSGNEHTY